MDKDEMKNKCAERAKIFQQAMESCKSSSPIDCIEWFADRIAELEKQISVLLSCKNCSENKGGLICAKEYENKCLAQKIEYIKELQKENAELIQNKYNLEYKIENLENKIEHHQEVIDTFKKKNTELKDLLQRTEMLLTSAKITAHNESADKIALLKENAELKLKLDALEGQTPWKDIKDKSEVIGKLTTAKEIIRDLLSCLYSVEYDRISDLEEAEQFLNSEVEK